MGTVLKTMALKGILSFYCRNIVYAKMETLYTLRWKLEVETKAFKNRFIQLMDRNSWNSSFNFKGSTVFSFLP